MWNHCPANQLHMPTPGAVVRKRQSRPAIQTQKENGALGWVKCFVLKSQFLCARFSKMRPLKHSQFLSDLSAVWTPDLTLGWAQKKYLGVGPAQQSRLSIPAKLQRKAFLNSHHIIFHAFHSREEGDGAGMECALRAALHKQRHTAHYQQTHSFIWNNPFI